MHLAAASLACCFVVLSDRADEAGGGLDAVAREEAHHDRPLRRAGHDGHHHRVRRAKAVSSAASLSRDVAASETDVASQPDEEVHCTGESGGVCVGGGKAVHAVAEGAGLLRRIKADVRM